MQVKASHGLTTRAHHPDTLMLLNVVRKWEKETERERERAGVKIKDIAISCVTTPEGATNV